jgi:Dolichyl-phosphate-mannose-protein mannosyltransferase
MQIDKNSLKPMNLAWIISIFFSFVIRFPNLYDKSYQWRPLQTEMTAYWFVREGINLMNYQTPLYGPPWQIPFEFPLFQATAAIMFKAGLGSFDFACRLTALLYFYISALFLYLLCRKIFSDHLTNLSILSLYLCLPYNIYYSTEPLIDYLALALALAYLYFILRWLDTHSSFWNALLATIFGSLGILVKPTTTPIVVIPIVVFVLRDILAVYGKDFKRLFDLRYLLNRVWTQRFYWFTLITMAVVPVLIGGIWTRHTDLIKENSIFTQWLTSKALVNWNFGTWALRADQNVWINYISEAERYFLPYGLSIFAILGIFIAVDIIASPGETTAIRLFIISVIASVGLVLTIFLNLYLHQYYYISFSTSMAILGGYGLARFWQINQKKRYIFTFVFAIWAIIFLAFNIKDYKMLRNMSISDNAKSEQSTVRARAIQQYIPSDKWAVVIEYDWTPIYIYPLERKAMVVTTRELDKPLCQILNDKRFTLVVAGDPSYDRNEELLNYTFKCFRSQKEVMPGIYMVTH